MWVRDWTRLFIRSWIIHFLIPLFPTQSYCALMPLLQIRIHINILPSGFGCRLLPSINVPVILSLLQIISKDSVPLPSAKVIYKTTHLHLIYNQTPHNQSLCYHMNPPSETIDIVAFDNSFSEEALRKYRQLFPDSNTPRPQKPNQHSSTSTSYQPSTQSQNQHSHKRKHRSKMKLPPADSHYRKWIRQIVDRKKKLSADFIRSINGLNDEDKKVEIWQRNKPIKQRKSYMPQVITNPFSEESEEESRSFASRSKSKRDKKRQRKQSSSSDQVQNPFYKECLEELQAKNEIPLSKTQQKMHKMERKCLQMLSDLKVEEKPGIDHRTISPAHPQLQNPENTQNHSERSVKGGELVVPVNKKMTVKQEESIETYNQRPNFIEPKYLCQVTPFNQLQCSDAKLEPTIGTHTNNPALENKTMEPSSQVLRQLAKAERGRTKGEPEERQQSRQKTEKRQEDRSRSKQLASIQAEKIKLIQKMQDLELKSIQPDLSHDDFKKIQHTKRKILKRFDTLTNQETLARAAHAQHRQSPSQTKLHKQTEWEKYQREKREKKEAEQRLWREYQSAVEERRRLEEQMKCPDRASTRQFQDFLDTKEELLRRANHQDRHSKLSGTARNQLQHSSSNQKKSRDKSDKDKYRIEGVKSKSEEEGSRMKQDRQISKELNKHKHRVERHMPNQFKDQSQPRKGELPSWREQLKKITGYDPKSSKYRKRDQEQIWESGFDRIQYEDKVSKLVGRKEEQEARAYDRQHTINQSDVDSLRD